MNLYSAFKQFAFKFDPEFIHDLTINFAHLSPHMAKVFAPLNNSHKYQLEAGELCWNFPVGVAAGFDKNARAISFFEQVGFGAIEVGTVTKQPQVGNPKPRIFRHPEINSIRNAMGFPNEGSQKILNNLLNAPGYSLCLGVNIGKNKDTTPEQTPEEYAYLYQMFAPHCQYLVVNISSPNTPGLRDFQKKELLAPILAAINEVKKSVPKPVFIKIAPDMDSQDLQMICELSKEYGFSGIIATNTTIQHDLGKGGVSGAYIKPYATKVRNEVCKFLAEDPQQIVIGVGGIDSYQEIKDFWKQGGSFAQIYTGFIYQGPALLKNIAKDIDADLKKYQFNNVQELFKNIKEID